MLALKKKKELNKAHIILKMLQKDSILELTKDIFETEMSLLCKECLSIGTQKFESMSYASVPLEKLRTFFLSVSYSISSPYELVMKKKIKHLLIHLFASGTVFPQIFSYLQIVEDEIRLTYTYSFEQMIRKQIPQSYNYDEKSQIFQQMIKYTESNLLIISLQYLHDHIKIGKNKKLSSIGYNNLKELLEQSHKIAKKCVQTDKQIEILKEIYEMVKQQISDSDDQTQLKESAKQFILKILILLLVKQEIIVPELLKLFQYSENRLIFKARRSVIILICSMPSVKKYIGMLKIDPFKQIWNETEIQQISDQVKTRFPQFLEQTFDQAVLLALELIVEQIDKNYYQIKGVFQDQAVQDLLKELEQVCGQQLKDILLFRMSYEEAQKQFKNSNLIQIGLIFYKIKTKLNKSDDEKSDKSSVEKQPINDQIPEKKGKKQKSIYERQILKYGSLNPIYFRFIAQLVEQRIPFFYILKTIKIGTHNLQPSYRLNVIRDLTYKKKFRKFMKDYYGFEMSKDKALNVQNLMELDAGKYKRIKGVAWPQLITQQLALIYEFRDRYKNKLIELGKTKDFKRICEEFQECCETNPAKIELQKVLKGLSEYIKSQKKQ